MRFTDDELFEGFTAIVKARLKANAEKKGTSWRDTEECSLKFLFERLESNLRRCDMVDVVAFAFMLWYRAEAENGRDLL